jgi:hypothetical protein
MSIDLVAGEHTGIEGLVHDMERNELRERGGGYDKVGVFREQKRAGRLIDEGGRTGLDRGRGGNFEGGKLFGGGESNKKIANRKTKAIKKTAYVSHGVSPRELRNRRAAALAGRG